MITPLKRLLYKISGNKRFVGLPFKFIYLNKLAFSKEEFLFLDVGCGNHSCSATKNIFPNCKYYGLDLNKDYNNDESEFKRMSGFFEANLESSDLSEIPDGMFDYINLSHVIEHIKNYEAMLVRLVSKLKKGGCIYLEYPAFRSTKLPHVTKRMAGSLNFFDDATHVHLHSNRDLANILLKLDTKIVKMGTRRSTMEILAIPIKVLDSLIKGVKIRGGFFWSFFGFADYIIAEKR